MGDVKQKTRARDLGQETKINIEEEIKVDIEKKIEEDIDRETRRGAR